MGKVPKMHLAVGVLSAGGSELMFCGKRGWHETGGEYSDAACNRFEATTDREKCTCKSCLAALKREDSTHGQ